jgi:hypothetical protein
MMDCSHSMAEEKMVGQTGGFSYTAPAKKEYKLRKNAERCFHTPHFAKYKS